MDLTTIHRSVTLRSTKETRSEAEIASNRLEYESRLNANSDETMNRQNVISIKTNVAGIILDMK